MPLSDKNLHLEYKLPDLWTTIKFAGLRKCPPVLNIFSSRYIMHVNQPVLTGSEMPSLSTTTGETSRS